MADTSNTDYKFRQWYDGKMRYLDQIFIGVGQIGFSDAHWVDLNAEDHEESSFNILVETGFETERHNMFNASELVVVGNIYQHSELLGGKGA